MTVAKKYDVIVIGTGAAGSTVAYACKGAGRTVAIIDSRPFGGTCALRGCDPKKVMVGLAETVDAHNRLLGQGIPGTEAVIDWSKLAAFKATFVESVPKSRVASYESAAIDTYHGRARFVSARELEVNGETLEAGHIAIATGAEPMDLRVPGAEFVITSDDWLDLKEMPKRTVFIGGGFISFEFAHIANAAGSEVTVLDRGKRPLKPFDSDLVGAMVGAAKKRGITVRSERPVSAVERDGSSFVVKTKTPDGGEEDFPADLVVHGAGRVPRITDLGLDAAGVETGRRGVKVNEYMQSVSNPVVYAAGDAAEPGPPLTPVAGREAEIAAENIINGNTREFVPPVVPSIVYTVPPLGSVGLLGEQAKEQGLDFKVNHADFSSWYHNRRLREEHAAYKILIDKQTDLILGAHFFGLAAEELINLFTLAINQRITATELRRTVFAYPTFSYDITYML